MQGAFIQKTVLSVGLALLMSSCYLFCLLKSDNSMEDVVENFIENALKDEDDSQIRIIKK